MYIIDEKVYKDYMNRAYKLKTGDKVKYNKRAQKYLGSSPNVIDKRIHTIKEFSKDKRLAYFKDGNSADVYWLKRA